MAYVAALSEPRDGLKGVRERLERWAAWVLSGHRLGMRHSSWGRWLDRGLLPPQGRSEDIERNPEAEETDAEIAKMPQWLREVVAAKYLSRGPDEVRAKRCHCSVATFKSRLQAAYCWLHARFDD